MNSIIVGEVTTSELTDAIIYKKCKQLNTRVRFLEAYYKCQVHSVYLMTLSRKNKLSTKDYTSLLKSYGCNRLLELYKDNTFRVYCD